MIQQPPLGTKNKLMKKLFSVLLLLIIYNTCSAQILRLGGIADAPTSTITETGTLAGFTAVSGVASSSQTFTISGTLLTASVVVTSPGTWLELSKDNTTWASTQTFTQSGGTIPSQPVTVYARSTAVATSGSYSGNITITSTGASTINVSASATVGSVLTEKYNFSSTSSSVVGYTNFFGDPTTNLSISGVTTGWILTSQPTWSKFSGFYGGVGNGATSSSTDGAFSTASINSNLYSYNLGFGLTGYNLSFTNLPAGTYSLEMIGSIPTSVYNTSGPAAFHVQFGTGSDNIATFTPNDNLTAVGPGTIGVQTGSFNGTITSGQTINIAVCTSGAGQLGLINGLIIKKTS